MRLRFALVRFCDNFLASCQGAARFPSAEAGRFGLDFAGLDFEAPFERAADFIDVDENAFADFDVGEISSRLPFCEASFRDGFGSGSK